MNIYRDFNASLSPASRSSNCLKPGKINKIMTPRTLRYNLVHYEVNHACMMAKTPGKRFFIEVKVNKKATSKLAAEQNGSAVVGKTNYCAFDNRQ